MKPKTIIPIALSALLIAGALILFRTKRDPLGGMPNEEEFWLS